MKNLSVNIVIWKEGKFFVAQCLNTSVSSFGKTKNEALQNIHEALELYFEDNDNPRYIKVDTPELIKSTLAYA